MLTITSFTEAHQLYQKKHIPWRILQDQAAVLIGICENQHVGIADARDISLADIAWLLLQPESKHTYADFLGGNVFVCHCEDDLKQVIGIDMDWASRHGDRFPNVTDQPMAWDSCATLAEESGPAEWALFLLCWLDSGGPTYYIPKHLWTAARVAEHIAETNRHWE